MVLVKVTMAVVAVMTVVLAVRVVTEMVVTALVGQVLMVTQEVVGVEVILEGMFHSRIYYKLDFSK